MISKSSKLKYLLVFIACLMTYRTASGFGLNLPSHILHISEYSLTNGLKIIVNENHKLPIFSMRVFVRGGGLAETRERAGISSFLALATGKSPDYKTIAEEIANLGGSISFSSAADGFFLSAGGQSKDLPMILNLMAKVMKEPLFKQKEVELARGLLLEGLRNEEKDFTALGEEKFLKAIYGDHPMGWGIEEHKRSFKSIGYSDLRGWFEKYFIPNNMVIVVSGDIKPKEVFEKSKEIFGAWRERKVNFPELPEIKRQLKRKEIFMRSEEKQNYIYFGHLGVARNNPDYYTLEVADAILGTNGLVSRIPKRVIRREGLAYNLAAGMTESAGIAPGYFQVYIETSSSGIKKIVEMVKREIDEVRNGPLSVEETNQAKSYLTGTYYFSFQSNDGICNYILECQTYGLPLDLIDRYPSLIASVTTTEVKSAARKYLDPTNYTLVVVSQKKQ